MLRRRFKVTILIVFAFPLALVVVGICEFTTRLFPSQVTLEEVQASLMREGAFSNSVGWQPNMTGTILGMQVFIDEFGFRKMDSPQKYNTSWLILGDSVTFGVGVETAATFAGRLQKQFPEIKIWNTAVLGYAVENYRDVVIHFMKIQPHPSKILLFFTLNDIYGYVNIKPRPRTVTEKVLSFLRRNSKFYVFLRKTGSDMSKRHFLYDYSLYKTSGESLVRALGIVDEIREMARAADIKFTVIILPYEYQLRKKDAQYLLPQMVLADYFKKRNISYLDCFQYFRDSGVNSAQLYLYGDSMHLSELGHRAVFRLLSENVTVW